MERGSQINEGGDIRIFKFGIVVFLVILLKPPYPHTEAQPLTDKNINNSVQEVSKEKPLVQAKANEVKPIVQEPSPQPVKPTPIQPKPAYSGDKQSWMSQAGIPESDWQYVDYIVTRESSWNPNAVNPNGGACGLVQALPCSKLGANWNDPVTALKWQYAYVNDRYGGYAGAYSFWVTNHWY